ncbi:hypothetical protein [Mesobacillus jeotgali]|uniref:DUF4825 domain-containing protein n=1 Tax=Mesobacillus jeotgali TaxID=129985 RepID=A0ABY9VL63_9BACI|nr:hypothetical protein [Mesobacillus jeotgali]WNF24701.1 hypothetical protein RH061_09520 [Mesobacillus jeotgali]
MRRGTVVMLIVLGVLVSGCSVGLDKGDIKRYVQREHEIKVEVPREPTLGAKSPSGSTTVISKDDPTLQFEVFFQSGIGPFFSSISGDSYKEKSAFNKLNKDYQNSPLYGEFKDAGFLHSKLVDSTFYSHDYDENEKKATLYLFKEDGFALQDSDYQMLFEAMPSILSIQELLSAANYSLEKIIVNGEEYSEFKNMYEYDNSSAQKFEIEVPVRNDLADIHSASDLKNLIHNDHYYGSLNTDTLVKKHFFKRDYPVFEDTITDIESLGFKRDENSYDAHFLSCENNLQNDELERINLTECQDYILFLAIGIENDNYKAIVTEEGLEKWWQMVQKLKSSTLNIHRVQVELLDSSIYYVDVAFEDVKSVQSKEDMKSIIMEEIGHLIK